jgi:hypothetical protein
MIFSEKRVKIWILIKRISKKLGIVDIPKETEENFWTYMRQPSETIRYLLIEHYNLDTDFFYHAFEESDLRATTEQGKLKEMFEKYFANDEGNYETLLLIDVKTMKAYTLSKEMKKDKEFKYVKKLI